MKTFVVLISVCIGLAIAFECKEERIKKFCGPEAAAKMGKLSAALGEECMKQAKPMLDNAAKMCATYGADKDWEKACTTQNGLIMQAIEDMKEDCLQKLFEATWECDADVLNMVCGAEGKKLKEILISKLGPECMKKGKPFEEKFEGMCTKYGGDKDAPKACDTAKTLWMEGKKAIGDECIKKLFM